MHQYQTLIHGGYLQGLQQIYSGMIEQENLHPDDFPVPIASTTHKYCYCKETRDSLGTVC